MMQLKIYVQIDFMALFGFICVGKMQFLQHILTYYKGTNRKTIIE